jgi:hypothetical protein
MHPLGDALVEWAGLTRPPMRSSAFVEARRTSAGRGEFLFLFNHSPGPIDVEYTLALRAAPSRVREIVTGETHASKAKDLTVRVRLPEEAVRVYRIDF